MRTSNIGINLIKEYESCKLVAYQCPAGIWTCGWGSTGGDIGQGTVWKQPMADSRLALDLRTFEAGVSGAVHVPLTQNMFDGLVSLAYNIGLGAFQKSTLLSCLNGGKYQAAADQFMVWARAGGKLLTGLQRRRIAEQQLFLSGIGNLKYVDISTLSEEASAAPGADGTT